MKMFSLLILGAVVLGTATVSVSGQGVLDIKGYLGVIGSFSTFNASLSAAGLTTDPGPYTGFLPTNAAVDALPYGLVDCLLLPQNIVNLTAILQYQAVDGKIMSTDFYDGMTLTTTEGSIITFPSGVKVNDASVILLDIEASNGVLHAIDTVLVPPTFDVGVFMQTFQPVVPASKSAKDAKAEKSCAKSNRAPKISNAVHF